MFDDTDEAWKEFGSKEPYYGVLTYDRFKSENINKENINEFFNSGEKDVQRILDNISSKITPDFKRNKALDFGSGTGRIVIPLSSVFDEVLGIDISDDMILEAQKNCKERNIKNVNFVKSDDDLSKVQGSFDFIHSYIVMQHIPVNRGEKIFKKLLSLLNDGGVGAIHFSYRRDVQISKYAKFALFFRSFPAIRKTIDFIKGRKVSIPLMQMNEYNINNLYEILQKAGIKHIFSELFDQNGFFTVTLYFQKKLSE